MKNVDLMVRMLEQAGCAGSSASQRAGLPLIDSLRVSSVDLFLTASESSAGFMAATVAT